MLLRKFEPAWAETVAVSATTMAAAPVTSAIRPITAQKPNNHAAFMIGLLPPDSRGNAGGNISVVAHIRCVPRRIREEQTYRYVQWTFFAALAAVVVGTIGVVVTLFH